MHRLSALSLRLMIPALALLLAGCEIPGMGPDPRIVQRESDAKAIGGACRYALRGIEDCYRLNEKASKTHIFEGWKEMDVYMRENKLEGQKTVVGEGLPAKEEIIDEKKPADEKSAEAKPKAGKPGITVEKR